MTACCRLDPTRWAASAGNSTDCDSVFASDLSGSSLMTPSTNPAAYGSPSTSECFAVLRHLTFAYICSGPSAAKSAGIIDFCVTCRAGYVNSWSLLSKDLI